MARNGPRYEPVESKVTAASLTTLIAGFAVGWIVWQAPLFAPLADPLQAVIASAVTSVLTFAAAWLSRHTPRPSDLR
jgi:hypothetical protein